MSTVLFSVSILIFITLLSFSMMFILIGIGIDSIIEIMGDYIYHSNIKCKCGDIFQHLSMLSLSLQIIPMLIGIIALMLQICGI